jgi:hypothetical protein
MGGGKLMEADINIANTTGDVPDVIPDTSPEPIPTIQVQVLTTIMSPPAFGLPIMREDFIIGTGPLRDARPIRQL